MYDRSLSMSSSSTWVNPPSEEADDDEMSGANDADADARCGAGAGAGVAGTACERIWPAVTGTAEGSLKSTVLLLCTSGSTAGDEKEDYEDKVDSFTPVA